VNLGDAWVGSGDLYGRKPLASVQLHVALADRNYERWRQDAKRLINSIDLDLPFWQRLASECSRFSFLLHNSPISPSHTLPQQMLTMALTESSYRQSDSAAVQDELDAFWASRAILRHQVGSPFLSWLREVHSSYEGAERPALLVAKKEWIQPTKTLMRSLAGLRRIDLIDLATLLEPHAYGRIYVCGATSLYPPAVFCCARAREIEWALFQWMKSDLPPRDVGLIASTHKVSPHVHVIRPLMLEPESACDPNPVDASGVWDFPPDELNVDKNSREETWFDSVQAIELILVDGSRTFAPVLEKISVATAADSLTPGSIWLTRTLGKNLAPGDFIIVRTYGETDVIQAYANELLGAKGPNLRRAQALWKAKLQELRQTMSIDDLVSALQKAGSPIADYQNVRNWISPRHIRTQNQEDFMAILRVCGLQDQAEQLWAQMGQIVRAHVRAGMYLKHRLTETLKQYSGSDLLAAGRLDVSLPGGNSGNLIAIQIERLGQQLEVREGYLLRLIEPWHA
jgi:hypothetical protein